MYLGAAPIARYDCGVCILLWIDSVRFMTSLAELARKHGTDKFEHGYCPHYEDRFGNLRDQPITLLEIGSWYGQSLRMWREYFPR